ncbi:hypothetical protein BBP40_001748 [Aspergillus hancockii]|nr:hypothetical protein BBP40_001748 [Aspergillus hancockii]
MESTVAQVRSLAGEADEAGRANIRRALLPVLSDLESPKETLMGLYNNHLQIATVRLAIDLGLFRSLSQSKTALQASQLTKQSGASLQVLERILRYLASNNLIIEVGQGEFKANKSTRLLANNVAEDFIYHAFETCGPAIQAYPSFFAETNYQEITSNTKTPFQKAFNTDLTNFAWLAQHPKEFDVMQRVMTTLKSSDWTIGFTHFEAEARTINNFPRGSNRPFLVDVGGGHGHQCIQLLNKFPNLSGWLVLQDLPQAVDKLPSIDGVDVVAHDFFQPQEVKGKYIHTTYFAPYPSSPTDLFQGAKFYYLRRILHDYPDAQCVQILKILAAGMASDSQLLIDEMVLPETNVPWQAAMADLSLMALLGGKERSKKQWEVLAEMSGLRVVKIHAYDTSTTFSVVVMGLE